MPFSRKLFGFNVNGRSPGFSPCCLVFPCRMIGTVTEDWRQRFVLKLYLRTVFTVAGTAPDSNRYSLLIPFVPLNDRNQLHCNINVAN
jgi:hypothetical protein